MDIETIDREELKAKLDRGDDFRLVMTLHDWAFRATHIPGSIHFHTVEDAYQGLSRRRRNRRGKHLGGCDMSEYPYRL